MTLYRKYRPQTLDQVIGQNTVTAILGQAIKSDKMAHAYLFAGPRGTGKTSVARIMARALNCQKAGQPDQALPCNQCDNCQAINSGAFLDVIELDAASNRGIDEIRSLKEQVALAPSLGKYKIYILDEVHMLTTEAFNALLKTLEEPPSHVIFVLCTTESHKVPVTIASRCQRFVFQRATPGLIQQQLRHIADSEQIRIEDDALSLLAELADGGFRDGAMLLEQMALAPSSNHGSESQQAALNRAAIEQRLGLASQELIKSIVAHAANHQPEIAIQHIEQFMAKGADSRYLLSNLIDQLRLLLFCKVSPEAAKSLADGPHLEWATQLAANVPSDYLVALVKNLATAQASKPSAYAALPLELALLDAARPQANVQFQTTSPVSSAPAKQPPANQATSAASAPPAATPKTAAPSSVTAIQPDVPPTSKPKQPTVPEAPPLEPIQLAPDSTIADHWPKILEAIRPRSRSVEALLRDCTPLSFDGTILLLQFWYAFHKKQLEMEKNREMVESVATQLLGTPVRIKCQLGDKSARPKKPMAAEDIHNIATVVEEPDLVEAAAEIFGGEIID